MIMVVMIIVISSHEAQFDILFCVYIVLLKHEINIFQMKEDNFLTSLNVKPILILLLEVIIKWEQCFILLDNI